MPYHITHLTSHLYTIISLLFTPIELWTPPENRDFWAGRAGMGNPHEAYASAAQRVKEIKQRAVG